MGLFDSTYVDCPTCNKPVEFQSHDGDPCCNIFTLDNAPTVVLCDVMNWPVYCENCGQWLALIDPAHPPGWRPKLQVVKVNAPDNPRTHFQGMRWWPEDRPFSFNDISPTMPRKDEG